MGGGGGGRVHWKMVGLEMKHCTLGLDLSKLTLIGSLEHVKPKKIPIIIVNKSIFRIYFSKYLKECYNLKSNFHF